VQQQQVQQQHQERQRQQSPPQQLLRLHSMLPYVAQAPPSTPTHTTAHNSPRLLAPDTHHHKQQPPQLQQQHSHPASQLPLPLPLPHAAAVPVAPEWSESVRVFDVPLSPHASLLDPSSSALLARAAEEGPAGQLQQTGSGSSSVGRSAYGWVV
jgi:hypothetical protein